jgi:O-antigen/teichoic acid export membrane protein
VSTAAARSETNLDSQANGSVAASIGRNTFYGFLSQFVQMATRLITVPIVISHLGIGGYGIWNVVMMTATYMRFGSVGLKHAYQKYVAEATANGNYEQAARLLSTGSAVMLVLSVTVLIPTLVLSRSIAAKVGIPPEFLTSSAGAISLLALIMVMSNVGAAFEAIVMGGHRIDLVRKFGTCLSVAEAVSIVIVLRLGLGLFAMAAVMGTSELIYIIACYILAHKVVPQIRLGMRWVTKSVLYELFRFAGSYQLVNLLEVLYVSIVPFSILKFFGADSAGVYAVVTRVVTSATVLLDAFLPPILSGGTLVYVSGSVERMQRLLTKAFKVTLGLALFPLGFIAVFGPTLAFAWTGATDPRFRVAFWLVCLTGLFRGFSLLALVLYRVSGKALMDNVRQVIRIAVILATALFAAKIGFQGVLAGLAVAEFVGMIFMIFALTHTFESFNVRMLVPDALRLLGGSALIFIAGVLASYAPIPAGLSERTYATVKLTEIVIGCTLMAWPALRGTGSVTALEWHALLSAVVPSHGRRAVSPAEGGGV